MTTHHLLDGSGEDIPGHRVLEGTDLEIAYNLQGHDLVIRVNKGGVLVFRVMLRDAAKEMLEARLANFNSLTIGDSEEGLNRMLRSAGVTEPPRPPAGGFLRWLTGRA